MSNITLKRKHTIGLAKAKVAAQKVADDLRVGATFQREHLPRAGGRHGLHAREQGLGIGDHVSFELDEENRLIKITKLPVDPAN